MIQSDGGPCIFDAPSICFYGGRIVLFPCISPTSPLGAGLRKSRLQCNQLSGTKTHKRVQLGLLVRCFKACVTLKHDFF